MRCLEKYIGLVMLIVAIGFNLWIFRIEPTAKLDPNDNTFQFALVDRTNQIFDFAQQKCSIVTKPFCMISYLVDHWVPNWAQGYNLPYYYSHLPQIVIVATFRFVSLFGVHISLFQYYHGVIYFLLSLFPLSLFIAIRLLGLSWISAGFGALIATQLSTDGLYGLDPSSFLWRGYGLSSQLFAMIWLPIAIAYAFRGKTVPAILALAATTAGHLGIGIIAFMTVAVTSLTRWKKLPLIFGGVLLLLGYWILPILMYGNYHNISVWDGIWKFDSFGYREVLKNLFNGDLFDFGRLPVLTALVFIGFFSSLSWTPTRNLFDKHRTPDHPPAGGWEDNIPKLLSFGILFIFWLILYFGRTTWGGLFDLIPGMSEFHLSRFIVGVHIAGLFLIPVGIEWLLSWSQRVNASKQLFTRYVTIFAMLIIIVITVFPQTLRYASHNDFLIKRANENFSRDQAGIDKLQTLLTQLLSQNPGRVYPGRGGSWGKNFRIAETPMYIHLSTYGVPIILWLPETWSPNSDTEQYFSENNIDHYKLYNVRYVVTPTDLAKENIQPFWKPVASGDTWNVYEVETNGYVTTGVTPAIVSSSKTDYRSVVRLWMHSTHLTENLYPELTFDTNYPKNEGLPNFRMLDEVTYKIPNGSTHNLFAEVPRYIASSQCKTGDTGVVVFQKSESDMVFHATVEVTNSCPDAIVILRQSYHPSWRATIDGKPSTTFAVFPFYTAVKVESPGQHEVVFSYEPSALKKFLLFVSFVSLLFTIWLARHNTLPKFKTKS